MTTNLTATAITNRAWTRLFTAETVAFQTFSIQTATFETALSVCTNLAAVVMLTVTFVDINARFEIIGKIEARWTFANEPAVVSNKKYFRNEKSAHVTVHWRLSILFTRKHTVTQYSPSFDVLALM